jgi:hypothetical protein
MMIATAVGVLLIVLALFFAIGRLLVEIGALPGRPPSEAGAMYSFFTSTTPAPFIAVATIYPIFMFCRTRFAKSSGVRLATLMAGLVIGLSLLPKFVPATIFFWCVPAALLGGGSSSSLGYYLGVFFQLMVGAVVLFCFRPRKSRDENGSA